MGVFRFDNATIVCRECLDSSKLLVRLTFSLPIGRFPHYRMRVEELQDQDKKLHLGHLPDHILDPAFRYTHYLWPSDCLPIGRGVHID